MSITKGKYGHSTALDVCNYIKSANMNPDDFFKFCVVRNPWNWYRSNYLFIVNGNNAHPDKEIVGKLSFSEFILWVRDIGSKRGKHITDGSWNLPNIPFHTFSEYIKDKNGNILVDKIIKLEELDIEFENICTKLNIDSLIKLGHQNKGVYNIPTEYTKETIEIVRELHKEDLEIFNYEPPII